MERKSLAPKSTLRPRMFHSQSMRYMHMNARQILHSQRYQPHASHEVKATVKPGHLYSEWQTAPNLLCGHYICRNYTVSMRFSVNPMYSSLQLHGDDMSNLDVEGLTHLGFHATLFPKEAQKLQTLTARNHAGCDANYRSLLSPWGS